MTEKKKSYNVKGTNKQKKAVKNISENIRTEGKSLIKAGYSKSVSEKPKLVTDSKGFLQLCEDYGLTDKLILDSLVSDIKAKKKNRVQELILAAKMKGHLIERVETKTESISLNINLTPKTSKQIADLTKLLKGQI